MNKLKELIKDHYYILTSVLFFLSFPSFDFVLFKGFPFFAWISLVPLFLFVRGKSLKEVFKYSFAAGLLGNFLAFRWVGAFGAKVPGGYIVVLLFLIPSMTVFFATKLLLAEFFSQKFEKLRFLIYPGFWILLDWFHTIGFLAFPWPFLGYSQYPFTSFIQISAYIGIMGITFIIVFSNYIFSDFLYDINTKKIKMKEAFQFQNSKGLLIVAVILILSVIYGTIVLKQNPSTGKKDLRVSMIQTCFSPWERWSENRFRYLDSLKYYTHQAMQKNPDFIVWSEYATLENISYDYSVGDMNLFEMEVLNIARQYERPILSGEIGIIDDVLNNRFLPQNNAVYINGKGEVVETYPKIYLVPFGEWFPYGKWLPLLQELLLSFGASRFVPGVQPMLFNINDRKFGNLICYEGIFYRLCRKYKQMGADFFVNITNDGWSNTYSGHIQHFSASVFRAIENGIWYVRAGNTGYTALIDPFGRVTESMPILEKGFITGDIDFNMNHSTFYTQFGDIFLYIVMLFLFMIFIIYSYSKLKYK